MKRLLRLTLLLSVLATTGCGGFGFRFKLVDAPQPGHEHDAPPAAEPRR